MTAQVLDGKKLAQSVRLGLKQKLPHSRRYRDWQ